MSEIVLSHSWMHFSKILYHISHRQQCQWGFRQIRGCVLSHTGLDLLVGTLSLGGSLWAVFCLRYPSNVVGYSHAAFFLGFEDVQRTTLVFVSN